MSTIDKLGVSYDWNDTISDTDEKSETLNEGDYDFEVYDLDRDWYDGGKKIPPCNQARLTLKVETESGTSFIYTNLYLCEMMEWSLVAFFRSIGQMPSNGDLVMDWDNVIGASGSAHITPETYTDQDGGLHHTYQVKFNAPTTQE